MSNKKIDKASDKALNKDQYIEDQKAAQFGVFCDETLFSTIEEKREIVEGMLYAGDINMLHGIAGEGKSSLVDCLVANCTTGDAFLDLLRIQGAQDVVLCQAEGHRVEQNERWKTLMNTTKMDISKLVHINTAALNINDTEDCERLAEQLSAPILAGKRKKYDLFILDSLYQTIGGDSSNPGVVAEWIRNFRRYVVGHPALSDAGFLIISHPKKEGRDQAGNKIHNDAGDAFGSVNWRNFFSGIWMFYKPTRGNTNGTKREIKNGKKRDADKMISKLSLDFEMETNKYFTVITGKKADIYDYLKFCNKWVSKVALVRHLGGEMNMSANSLIGHANKLIDERLIRKEKRNGKLGYIVNGIQEEMEDVDG